MFGWKRRRARKRGGRAVTGGAHLEVPVETTDADDADVSSPPSPPPSAPLEPVAASGDDDGPGPEGEPESEPDVVRTERPMVDLLTDGERLGFDPELHVPVDED